MNRKKKNLTVTQTSLDNIHDFLISGISLVQYEVSAETSNLVCDGNVCKTCTVGGQHPLFLAPFIGI